MSRLHVRKQLVSLVAIFSILGTVTPSLSLRASAYIFSESDTDTSICANIGTKQHGIPSYPDDWPRVDALSFTFPPTLVKVPLEGGVTNWHCRTDTGLTTGGQSCMGWNGQSLCAGGQWSFTIPIGTPVAIGKQDIEHFSGTGSFPKDLSKVEWDLDGNGSFETVDNGPWVTAQGTQNEQVDSVVTAWTTRARYFETTFTPLSLGNSTVQMRVSWTDGSSVTSSGVFTAITDTATAGIARIESSAGTIATGPVLTGSNVHLSAASSIATSGFFSRFEWDLDGDGIYETDGGTQNVLTTSFVTPGNKSVGVRVTSRGGSSSSATMTIEVRQSPPSGEPGVSINDGATATNSKSVSLNLAWPEFATEARISNDGGFAPSKTRTVPLSSFVDWELDDSIKGLFTKVVYVRFNGSGIDNTKTYSDDIILDTTAPKINSSSAVATSSRLNVKVDAIDDITGVEMIEIDNGRKKISKKYSKTLKVSLAEAGLAVAGGSVSKSSVRTLRVRVRDGAGNWTKWRNLSLSGRSVVVVQGPQNSKALSLTTEKSVSSKAIAKFVRMNVPKYSKMSLKVSSSSKTVCRATGSSVRGLKSGNCKVTVIVKPKSGRAITKSVTLRVL
jgi:hypothetical protein